MQKCSDTFDLLKQ